MEVLRKAKERAVKAATRANRESLWHTWTTFSRAWGLPPLHFTVDKVRAVWACFQDGRCRVPEQYVSEARRRHTSWTGFTLDLATELVFRCSVRSCERGMGPSSAKDIVSWLLLVSKRDPFAVGETRSRGCGCIAGVRHTTCPLSSIIGVFGRDIEHPVGAFPTSHGSKLHKYLVVAAHREVIAQAGVNTTKVWWPRLQVAKVAGLWARFDCSNT